ncbi:MAG: hydrogenase maturation nickel metallochaperone HypA [Pirellulales bacterium]|nr:hydrogenase maturation nickel metallochaperone HypA [Pirellulales bacterium]
MAQGPWWPSQQPRHVQAVRFFSDDAAMHEVSLARALVQQVRAIAAQHPGCHVTEVRVSVGPLSGVEPALLASAAQRLFAEHGHPQARLVVQWVELLARCRCCGQQFEVPDLVLRCPGCGAGQVQVMRGDALRLETVQLAEAEQAGAAP